jgi:endonuclease/exonuclease/phosphatase family metal-dependent hydrolase
VSAPALRVPTEAPNWRAALQPAFRPRQAQLARGVADAERMPRRPSSAIRATRMIGLIGSLYLTSCLQLPPQERQGASEKRGERALAAMAAGTELRLITWNLNWFLDDEQGPVDDALQFESAAAILEGSHASLIALQEVASQAGFDRLLRELVVYQGVLSDYPSAQKLALLWDAKRFAFGEARSIVGLDDAGRPPLQVTLRSTRGDLDLMLIVIHAKAYADPRSHAQRARFAAGLKAQLDALPAETALIVAGDFNDRLLGSVLEGADTPYRAFLQDAAYVAATEVLNHQGRNESSHARGSTIDHVIMSDELGSRLDPASVDVLRDELQAGYPSFATTVSDHFPVLVGFLW